MRALWARAALLLAFLVGPFGVPGIGHVALHGVDCPDADGPCPLCAAVQTTALELTPPPPPETAAEAVTRREMPRPEEAPSPVLPDEGHPRAPPLPPA